MSKFKLGDIVKVLKESKNYCSNGSVAICSYGTVGNVCHIENEGKPDEYIMIEAWDQDGEIDVFSFDPDELELVTDYTPYEHLHKFRTSDKVITISEVIYKRTIGQDKKTNKPIYGETIIIPVGTIGEVIYCGSRNWSYIQFDYKLLTKKDLVCVDNSKIELFEDKLKS